MTTAAPPLDEPPAEVRAAAAIVDAWVRRREAAIATAAGAPTTAPVADPMAGMSWAERLDFCRERDQAKMPENRYDVARRQGRAP